MTKMAPIDDDVTAPGHIDICYKCGRYGVWCETAVGEIVVDGLTVQMDLADDLVPLLVGRAVGTATDSLFCAACASPAPVPAIKTYTRYYIECTVEIQGSVHDGSAMIPEPWHDTEEEAEQECCTLFGEFAEPDDVYLEIHECQLESADEPTHWDWEEAAWGRTVRAGGPEEWLDDDDDD